MRLVTILLSLALALATLYRIAKAFGTTSADHGLRLRIHEDCQTAWFASRYGDLCDKDRLAPPGGFISTVFADAFFDGNYCVLMDCDVLCSARGALYTAAGGFVGWMLSDITF